MKRPLMGMGIVFVSGVAAGLSDIFWVWIFLMAAAGFICLKCWTESSNKYLLGLSVLFIVGFCRTFSINSVDSKGAADEKVDSEWIVVEGIDDEWTGNEDTSDFVGRVYKVQEKEKCTYLYMKISERGKALVIVMKDDKEQKMFYKGQIYRVSGEAEAFEKPGNPGQFDEAAYYASQDLECRIWAENLELMGEGNWLDLQLRLLDILKAKMLLVYSEHMSAEGAGVIRAAVLGDRSEFQEDLRSYYQENGWMHLVTTSGLHLSFIAMGMYEKLRKCTLPPLSSTLCAFLLMLAYGYMSDFGDSMLRAMGTMVIVLLGRLLGRRTDALTSLTLLAGIMLFIRPLRLTSSGFLLTFGAVLGMELGKWFLKTCLFYEETSDEKGSCKMKFVELLCIQTGILL